MNLVPPHDADQPTPTNPIGDPRTFSFLNLTTRPSFRPAAKAEFKAGDGGKIGGAAVYTTRCVNTRGEKGPWSETTTATVAACVRTCP